MNREIEDLLERYEPTLVYVISILSTKRAGQNANEAACELNTLIDDLEKLETVSGVKEKLDALIALLDKPKRKAVPYKRKEYHPEFDSAWKQYPKRNGGNDKYLAESCWINRIKEADDKQAEMVAIEMGVQRYCLWCDTTEKSGTEYVMQAQRFFGRGKHYLEDWALPKPEEKKPRTEKEKLAWCRMMGFEARAGESYIDFFIRAGVPR
jgi:hypothetical protein